jgi:5-methylcytosine-specific restriction endonuclease McrA
VKSGKKLQVSSHLARKRERRLNPVLYRARRLRQSYLRLKIDRKLEDIIKDVKATTACAYCTLEVSPLDLSLDHILPSARGGADSLENLHLVCFSCNLFKGSLTDGEFRQLLEFVKDKPEMRAILKKRLKAAGFLFGG